MYSRLCYVEADLSHVRKEERYSNYRRTSAFYEVHFDIILALGLTEFRACIAWKENVSGIRPFFTMQRLK